MTDYTLADTIDEYMRGYDNGYGQALYDVFQRFNKVLDVDMLISELKELQRKQREEL